DPGLRMTGVYSAADAGILPGFYSRHRDEPRVSIGAEDCCALSDTINANATKTRASDRDQ
ncbi:MAG TPA: hypothetical protein VFB24_01020, partial [Candidatus Binatia bacterium]|nr:hypothetical protein [Candidatus Binatia bacterium]